MTLAHLTAQEPGPHAEWTVSADTLPRLKRGPMKNLKQIQRDEGVYDIKRHNQSDHIFRYPSGGSIEFVPANDPDKFGSSDRQNLFICEGNRITYDSYIQLAGRTTGKILIDFNPSDLNSYLYDLMEQPGVSVIHSTYLDNIQFLSPEQVAFYESLKDVDENTYNIYVLGLRGQARELVYKSFTQYSELPSGKFDRVFWIDFGFSNSPTAFGETNRRENELYHREHIYETGQTNSDLIDALRRLDSTLRIKDSRDHIVCDGAEPQRIEELKRAGFNVHAADKSAGSVNAGIDYTLRYKHYVHDESLNMIKEFENYKFATGKDGKPTDRIVKLFDHCMNGMRYGVYTFGKKYWSTDNIRAAKPIESTRRTIKSQFAQSL